MEDDVITVRYSIHAGLHSVWCVTHDAMIDEYELDVMIYHAPIALSSVAVDLRIWSIDHGWP
jgi:hypothetical protein